jgi:hypothetical protein
MPAQLFDQRSFETDYIGIVAGPPPIPDPDAIARPDGLDHRTPVIEKRQHILFVGDSDIQPA